MLNVLNRMSAQHKQYKKLTQSAVLWKIHCNWSHYFLSDILVLSTRRFYRQMWSFWVGYHRMTCWRIQMLNYSSLTVGWMVSERLVSSRSIALGNLRVLEILIQVKQGFLTLTLVLKIGRWYFKPYFGGAKYPKECLNIFWQTTSHCWFFDFCRNTWSSTPRSSNAMCTVVWRSASQCKCIKSKFCFFLNQLNSEFQESL